MLRRQVELFFCAVQFLTRLPIPILSRFEPDWITRAARWFPLAGQVVGGLSALVLLAAAQLWSSWIAALLATAAGVLFTGAFHEDGLADTADGLGGGQTPERRLEIMKDSRVGTYGLVALVLVLGLKIAALAALPPAAAALGLLAAHGAGRGGAVLVMRLSPYAGDVLAAKWKPVPDGVRWSEVLLALTIAAWPMFLLPALNVLFGLAIGGAMALAVVLLARRLIGGHTGDVLGAVEQMFELGVLLGLAAAL